MIIAVFVYKILPFEILFVALSRTVKLYAVHVVESERYVSVNARRLEQKVFALSVGVKNKGSVVVYPRVEHIPRRGAFKLVPILFFVVRAFNIHSAAAQNGFARAVAHEVYFVLSRKHIGVALVPDCVKHRVLRKLEIFLLYRLVKVRIRVGAPAEKPVTVRLEGHGLREIYFLSVKICIGELLLAPPRAVGIVGDKPKPVAVSVKSKLENIFGGIGVDDAGLLRSAAQRKAFYRKLGRKLLSD